MLGQRTEKLVTTLAALALSACGAAQAPAPAPEPAPVTGAAAVGLMLLQTDARVVDVAPYLPAPGTYVYDTPNGVEEYLVLERDDAVCLTRVMTCLKVAADEILGTDYEEDEEWGFWMPRFVRAGAAFGDEGFSGKVLSTDASVSTGGGTWEHCLLLEITVPLNRGTSVTKEWWAPGRGIVRQDETSLTEETELELIRPVTDEEHEAEPWREAFEAHTDAALHGRAFAGEVALTMASHVFLEEVAERVRSWGREKLMALPKEEQMLVLIVRAVPEVVASPPANGDELLSHVLEVESKFLDSSQVDLRVDRSEEPVLGIITLRHYEMLSVPHLFEEEDGELRLNLPALTKALLAKAIAEYGGGLKDDPQADMLLGGLGLGGKEPHWDPLE